ncbi:MAG: LPS export ABC transporter periplasmic protein LptC [Gemmatimonadota bacterium]
MNGPGSKRGRSSWLEGSRPQILGLLAAVTLAAGCSDDPSGSGDTPSIFDQGADQVMFGVEHYLTRDGLRRGAMKADTALTFEDASTIALRRLEIRFFDEAGADRGVLTAKSGDYDLETGGMTVRDQVKLDGRLQNEAPSQLETDSLVYDPVAGELRTDAIWTLRHADGTIERGNGLVTDPALENIRASDWTVTTPDVAVPQ